MEVRACDEDEGVYDEEGVVHPCLVMNSPIIFSNSALCLFESELSGPTHRRVGVLDEISK